MYALFALIQPFYAAQANLSPQDVEDMAKSLSHEISARGYSSNLYAIEDTIIAFKNMQNANRKMRYDRAALVDYSQPLFEKRLFIFQVNSQYNWSLIRADHVSHGRGSDHNYRAFQAFKKYYSGNDLMLQKRSYIPEEMDNLGVADHFSDDQWTYESEVGIALTEGAPSNYLPHNEPQFPTFKLLVNPQSKSNKGMKNPRAIFFHGYRTITKVKHQFSGDFLDLARAVKFNYQDVLSQTVDQTQMNDLINVATDLLADHALSDGCPAVAAEDALEIMNQIPHGTMILFYADTIKPEDLKPYVQ